MRRGRSIDTATNGLACSTKGRGGGRPATLLTAQLWTSLIDFFLQFGAVGRILGVDFLHRSRTSL